MALQTDIAIIGAGPGGYVAALRAAQMGADVTVIDKRRAGGVCLNEGCIPTKAMLRTAEVYALARGAGTFGVGVQGVSLDWGAAQKRMRAVVEQEVRGVEMLLSRAGVRLLIGEAAFMRPDILSVRLEDGEERVQARQILIATGSRTARAPIPGLDGPRVVDHWGALNLEALPASVCIIGAGAIGLEFASIFCEMGVEVTLVEMLPRIAPLMDQSVGEGLAWSLERRGVEILTSTRVTAIEHGAEGSRVAMATPEGERAVEVEVVLSAIGRSPNIEGLGLEVLGLKPTRAGIAVDSRMHTAVPGVYAIGDVAAEGPMLAHVASRQGIVAVEDALGHTARMDYSAVPNCIFTLPEAASVGLTEEQARGKGIDVATGVFALANNGKAVAYGDTEGFVKVVADRETDAVLGVHVVGPHASDLILEGTVAIALESTLDEIERTIHPHPTLGEAIVEAVLAVRGRALHLPRPR